MFIYKLVITSLVAVSTVCCSSSSGGPNSSGGGTAATGSTGNSGNGGASSNGGGSSSNSGAGGGSGNSTSNTGGSTAACIVPADANTRRQGAYPAPSGDAAQCGAWALVDNVCCAQYCNTDNTSESCSSCSGTASCVAVNSKGCKSGQWPEVHCVTDSEAWHYSRSTHYGLTRDGACGFGLYGMCTTSDKYTFAGFKADCDAFCKAYPDLCKDPDGITLRGNFAAPQGNYYTQFWPSLDGDLDNYLSCGECFEIARTKQDGTEYVPGETGYTQPVVVQITDSCPCSANSKWCCGSGRDHCGEVTSGSSNFKYGCPLPPGNLPADHDPQVDESIHIDLSDIAMARLQSGNGNGAMPDGVIPTKYKRIACPVVGNMYVWLLQGESYYFRLVVVNVKGLGSVTKVEAQLPNENWVTLTRDPNYSSTRPQERSGTWATPQGVGPFQLPITLRFTDPSGRTLTSPGVIKTWPTTPSDPNFYLDTGVQF